MVVATALALAGCDGGGERPESETDRALEAIRECRVRLVLSRHDGRLLVELKDGGTIDLPVADQRRVYLAIGQATERCGTVTAAIE